MSKAILSVSLLVVIVYCGWLRGADLAVPSALVGGKKAKALNSRDPSLAELLIGTWLIHRTNNYGVIIHAKEYFRTNGTFGTQGEFLTSTGAVHFNYTGTWRINDYRLCKTVTNASLRDFVLFNEACSRLISVTTNHYSYSNYDGIVYSKDRVR